MKYLHHMRDHQYPNIPVTSGIDYLFDQLNIIKQSDNFSSLMELRQIDKLRDYKIKY
ncbi:MAG: hypothetical protein R2771_16210 [Saprospiraceae bacterium]